MEMIYSRVLALRIEPDTKTIINTKNFSMTNALARYHRLKGGVKTKLFFEPSERSMLCLIDCLGHDNLAAIEISDASRFRDYLFDRDMWASSVKRVFSSVRAVINLVIREQGLSINNIFSGTFIPDDEAKTQRLPIPTDVLLTIQHECIQLDDEPRWLIALIGDTGMRLSEACGLPQINFVVQLWGWLKTDSSSRQIPLVGNSLWTTQRVVKQRHQFAFPKYCNQTKCNANSANAALNKWLKTRVPDGYVMQLFRHNLRDRLRAVESPATIINALGGLTTEGVGRQDGKGHSLTTKHI